MCYNNCNHAKFNPLEGEGSCSLPSDKKYPFVVNHLEKGGCGKAAFYLDRLYDDQEVLSAEHVQYLDGTFPDDGEVAMCGSCGSPILRLYAEHIFPRDTGGGK